MPSSHGVGQISCIPCMAGCICLARKTRLCATHPSRIYLICVRADSLRCVPFVAPDVFPASADPLYCLAGTGTNERSLGGTT